MDSLRYSDSARNRVLDRTESCRSPVLRLCSVKNRAKAQGENWVILNRQKEVQETQCSLFPIGCRLPKLDVAGSTPVSRSIFSIIYEPSPHPPNPPFGCKYHIFSYLRSI